MSVEDGSRREGPRGAHGPHGAHGLAQAFGFAAQGVRHAFATQRNMRIDGCCAVAALLLCAALRVDVHGWVAVLLCIGAVLGAECMNTAVEAAVDAACPDWSQPAKHAKDCAAGAVLVVALAAAAVGVVVYGAALAALLG